MYYLGVYIDGELLLHDSRFGIKEERQGREMRGDYKNLKNCWATLLLNSKRPILCFTEAYPRKYLSRKLESS